MTQAEYAALVERLRALADPVYREFSEKLTPGARNILGVRTPRLQAVAKELARADWRGYLAAAREDTFEETKLQGLVLGHAKASLDDRLPFLAAFVSKIDNWAVCDACCAGFKIAVADRGRMLEFLLPLLRSEKEFEVRFAVVMLMSYYVEESFLGTLFDAFDGVVHEGYYARMGVAWAVSVCFAKFLGHTMEYLKNNSLDDFTYNKSLQKILESNRVDGDAKERIRKMKRRARNSVRREPVG